MEKRQICFIRHGITAGNEQKKYIGSTDEPISDAGRKSLIKRASEGIYGTPDIVFSSPMKRCIETAQILFPEKKAVIIDKFRECDFGLWEGKDYRQIIEDLKLREGYQAWIDSMGEAEIPRGEKKAAFIRRSIEGYDEMLKMLEEYPDSAKVACVVHGGTIMAVLSERCGDHAGDYYEYQVPNGSGFYAEAYAGRLFRIKRISNEL